jgi:hypothetical protein
LEELDRLEELLSDELDREELLLWLLLDDRDEELRLELLDLLLLDLDDELLDPVPGFRATKNKSFHGGSYGQVAVMFPVPPALCWPL